VNSYYPGLKFPHVSIDDKMAGKTVTRHLIHNGHRKIAGVFKLDDGQGHLRYAGYMQAMAEAKLAVDDENIIWLDTEDLKRMDLIWEKIKSRIRGCTAITCYNDEVAYGLICLFQTHGIAVPQDISLASIDNSDLIKQSPVALTSVPHPMEHLGQKAAENIVRMIYDPDYDGKYEFEVNVISRQSVKKIT
jgi:GntR family transcriptional regulator of arabinose operon